MTLWHAACFAIVISGAASAFAQESLVGTYNGNYELPRGTQRFGITLVISSAEDGKVKGNAIFQRGNCQGSYPVEGGVKGNTIRVRATAKGGPAGDCFFSFSGTVDGNRLVGKMGNTTDVEFRR